MALTIKIKRATRSSLTAAAASSLLNQGELYLITDENKLVVGLSSSTFAEAQMDGEELEYLFFTNFRIGERGGAFVVDQKITETGWTGVENTDWENLTEFKREV